MQRVLRSLELFTGAGGLALGTHEAGFRHNALLEWNQDACDTLRTNSSYIAVPGISKWQVEQGDVHDYDLTQFGPVDLVAGGPPCQPFSIGGKHKGMDDRRDLIPEFIRAVRELQPRAFIMENVKGLTRQSFRNYFEYTQLQLTYPTVNRGKSELWEDHLARLEDLYTSGRGRDLKYNVVSRLLNSANYGVPQTRERVFIVGFRADLGIDWHFPEPTHSRDRLIYDQWVSGQYWERHRLKRPKHINPRVRSSTKRLQRCIAPSTEAWRTVRDAISDLPKPGTGNALNHVFQPGAKAYIGHTGSVMDWPSKTLKAGVHGVPGGENMIDFEDGTYRYFSVREAARIQTFPDEWRFLGAWSESMRQLGNAVPMLLAQVVSSSVANRLRQLNAK